MHTQFIKRSLFTTVFTSSLLLSAAASADGVLSGINTSPLTIDDDATTSIVSGTQFQNDSELSVIGWPFSVDPVLANQGTFINNGTFYGKYSDLNNSGILLNTGSMTTHVSDLNNVASGQITNTGYIENKSGRWINDGQIDNQAEFLNQGTFSNNGQLTNNDILTNTSTLSSYRGGTVTNNGILTNSRAGKLNNYIASTLVNNGTLNNEGTFTNAGRLINQGSMTNNYVLTNAINDTVVNNGVMTNNKSIYNQNAFVNTGTFINNEKAKLVGSGAWVGDYTQTTGKTINNGTISQTSVNINGGNLSGTGTIKSHVTVNGTGYDNYASLTAGNSIGTMTINGNYTQGEFGSMVVEFDETHSDLLDISGVASLAGLLSFEFIGDDVQEGTFNFLTFASIVGSFDSIILPAISGFNFEVVFGDTFANLVVSQAVSAVPIPAAFFLLAPVLFGFLGLRRKASLVA